MENSANFVAPNGNPTSRQENTRIAHECARKLIKTLFSVYPTIGEKYEIDAIPLDHENFYNSYVLITVKQRGVDQPFLVTCAVAVLDGITQPGLGTNHVRPWEHVWDDIPYAAAKKLAQEKNPNCRVFVDSTFYPLFNVNSPVTRMYMSHYIDEAQKALKDMVEGNDPVA